MSNRPFYEGVDDFEKSLYWENVFPFLEEMEKIRFAPDIDEHSGLILEAKKASINIEIFFEYENEGFRLTGIRKQGRTGGEVHSKVLDSLSLEDLITQVVELASHIYIEGGEEDE